MKIYNLENEFSKSNRTYKRVIDESNYFVYEVTTDVGYGDSYVHYEIAKKRVKKLSGYRATSVKYVGYDAYEVYPSDEEFGYNAWATNKKYLNDTLKRLVTEGKI